MAAVTVSAWALDPKRRRRYLQIAFGFGALVVAIVEAAAFERVVSISVGSYFGGGIETEEQLDAALEGVREECARLIGAGKKIIVQ